MSQPGSFISGFLAGTLVGGVIGGVVGAVVASRLSDSENETPGGLPPLNGDRKKIADPERQMETARRGLETKIAQLNEAIDDVRQQLGTVNGSPDDRTPKPLSNRET